MTTKLELKLSGGSAASGQIRLAHLAPISASLQEVATRVGRHIEGRSGPGRSHAVIEALTTLTLVGIGEGSTVLRLRRGDDTALDLDLETDREIDSGLVDVLEAVRVSRRPEWMGDALAESTGRFLAAVRAASREVTVTITDRGSIHLNPASLGSPLWTRVADQASDVVTLIGRLIAVDVESHRFSIRDDAGSRVPLDRVADAETAAVFVGRRVRARGTSIRDPQGHIVRLAEADLEAAEQPPPWSVAVRTDMGALMSQSPGPDPDGGVALSDEDYETFLRAVHG